MQHEGVRQAGEQREDEEAQRHLGDERRVRFGARSEIDLHDSPTRRRTRTINGCVLSMSSDEWLFDLMKEYWMDPCTAVVRPYSPAELQAHNLCAAVPPMIFMFALVGFVSLMAYLQSRGEQQKLRGEQQKLKKLVKV